MSDRAVIPADVLREIADDFDRNADGNRNASRTADDPHLSGHFAGKADAYRVVAQTLREYADGAEATAEGSA